MGFDERAETIDRYSSELGIPKQLIAHMSIESRARIEAERMSEEINDALEVAEEWGD